MAIATDHHAIRVPGLVEAAGLDIVHGRARVGPLVGRPQRFARRTARTPG